MTAWPVLPSGWVWATPTQVVDESRYPLGIGPFGSNLKVSDYAPSGVPLVFVRNIRAEEFEAPDTKFVSEAHAAELMAHTVLPGDVLVTKMGDPPGDSALYPIHRPVGIITADCIKWRISPEVGSPKYFVYVIRAPSVQRQILDITRGVAQRKVSLARFKTVRVPLAPRPEQRRVVAALDSYFSRLDTAEAALKRVQANLNRYRASVLKAAVEGRLVPTEAELARQEGRDYEPASTLLQRILAERRRRWEEAELAKMQAKGKVPKDDRWKAKYKEPEPPAASDLPCIPDGWCWTTVDAIAQVAGGLAKGKKRRPGVQLRKVNYLRVANVQRGFLDLSHVKEILATDAEVESLALQPGDVLFNEGGDRDKLGRGWIWDGQIPDCIHQNHVFRARLFTRDLLPKFLSWYGNSAGQLYFFRQGRQTTNLASISLSRLRSLPVPIPPTCEQERMAQEIEWLFSLGDAVEHAVKVGLTRTDRLRQSILKWAFGGKLVDQDPEDEPAYVLLDRINSPRQASAGQSRRRRKRRPASEAQGELFSQ